MGRIPNFRDSIFPQDSLPNLTLVANLGLVLYLFLIGLETDVRFLVSNWRIASAVAFAGLALPFGLGCALAWGLYNEFRNDPGLVHIEFSTYLLFIGVAIAITAFPVLCRILTELNLLNTTAGIITLSAGVANDVIGKYTIRCFSNTQSMSNRIRLDPPGSLRHARQRRQWAFFPLYSTGLLRVPVVPPLRSEAGSLLDLEALW